MRRSVLVVCLTLTAALGVVPPVHAMGPGGWDHVGHGSPATRPSLDGWVFALNADAPGELLVGGAFTAAGGNPKAARIATWNGTSWGALGTTPLTNGSVHAIAYHAGKVYVGGTFQNAGGNPNADFLAVWNGAGWAPFCTSTNASPTFNGNVNALQIIGNTLYVGGSFQNGAGIVAADYLLACDLTTGASSSTVTHDGDFSGGVYALTADSNGTLYAGGTFINVAGIPTADHVAAYHGTWQAMGTGPTGRAVDGYVRSLAAHGTDVYVGADSVDIAGIANADHVARWNGSAWSAVGSNTAHTNGWFPATAFFYGLSTMGSFVFAAGSFQNANGIAAADNLAYFDGTTWRPIGSDGAGNGPLLGQLTAVQSFRGKVYAAGNFTRAGGDGLGVSLGAYALTQPDALVALKATGPWAGNGVFSATGAGESRALGVVRGRTGRFYVTIQNDGLVAASFTLRSAGAAHGFTVRYFRGHSNITTKMLAGTYTTGAIGPRSSVILAGLVTLARTTAPRVTYLVRATSVSGIPADAVRAIVTAR